MAFIGQKYSAFNAQITVDNKALIDQFLSGNLANKNFQSNAALLRNYAFATSDIISVNMPNATSLGAYAFYGCSSLKTIILPALTHIFQNYNFNYCSVLEYLSLPSCIYYGFSTNFLHTPSVAEVILNTTTPFKLSYDSYSALQQLKGGSLTMKLDTQDASYASALAYILALDFDEFNLYDEDGEEIDI